VVTTCLEGDAYLWDRSGGRIAALAPGQTIAETFFSPDGERVLTVSTQGRIQLWDLEGHEAAALARPAVAASYAPSGGRVLTRESGGASATIWTAEGRELRRLSGHGATILSAVFSRRGDRIATASLDSTARLWDAEGNEIAVLRHDAPVHHARYGPDGERIVTLSSDRTARLWTAKGESLGVLGASGDHVGLAVFSPDGAHLFTAAFADAEPRLWDRDGNLRAVLPAPGGRVLEAVFSPDGRRLLTLSRDLTLRMWLVHESDLLAAERALPSEAFDTGVAAAAIEAGGTMRGDYVGTATCARCHRDAYGLWRASAHASTFALADAESLPAEVREGGRVEHPPGSSLFIRDGDRMLVETLSEHGRPKRYDLTHVAGARRIRMFVATLPDGRTQVLPAMRELPDGPWFDYTHLIFGAPGLPYETPPVVDPGDASFWTGPVRSWDARCAVCHVSGREPRAPGPDGTGPRSTWRAMAVDCEACHGPGRAHSEAWDRLETDAPLPRLETLDREGLVQACTQCHMEGERLTPHYVVGEDLFEHLDPTLVVDPERADPYGRALELIYDGLPFGTSRCAEEGGLTCSTCHAPHGSEQRSLLRRSLDDGSLCAECHVGLVRGAEAHAHHDAAGEGGRCIACHMPFLTIERGHGHVADHSISIPRLDLPGDRVAVDACTWCHEGRRGAPPGMPALSPDALRTAYAAWWPDAAPPRRWMHALAAARTGQEGAVEALADVLADRSHPRLVRASAARLLDRFPEAGAAVLLDASRDDDSLVRRSAVAALASFTGEAVDRRLEEALSDPSGAVQTAAARAALQGWARVRTNDPLLQALLPVLEEDARRVPDDEIRWFLLGAARDVAGDVAGAIGAYERMIALDPFAAYVRERVRQLASEGDADVNR
jgi:predicted CXXCH cytochrome family protein